MDPDEIFLASMCPLNKLAYKGYITSLVFEKDFCFYKIKDGADHILFLLRKHYYYINSFLYLEKYIICIIPDEENLISDFWGKLYNIIANQYEQLIDIKRNIENIENLLDILINIGKLEQGTSIIDYGCGTGISLRASKVNYFDILGIDINDKMLKIAISKGLKAYNLQYLKETKYYFNGAFSSYALHLFPQYNDVKVLWDKLLPSATLVANFHKGNGIEYFSDIIKKLGGKCKKICVKKKNWNHGDYFAFYR